MAIESGQEGQGGDEYLLLADSLIQGAEGNRQSLRAYLAALLKQGDSTAEELKQLRRLVASKHRDNRALAEGIVEERKRAEELEQRLTELRAKIEGSGAKRLPLSMPETMAVVREQVDRMPPMEERAQHELALEEISRNMLRILPLAERALDSPDERVVSAATSFIESIHFRLPNRFR